MNVFVSYFPSIPRSMVGGNVDPSHSILIDIVWVVACVCALQAVSLSASLISVTNAMTSVDVIG